MSDQAKHETSSAGPPPATGIFKPRFMEVEESVDMDERFRQARRMAAGEKADESGGPAPNLVEGQHAVAIVTPGRLVILDPCPKPGTVPEEQIADMCQLFPPENPLTISAISYTNIEALTTDMTQTIPFRGFLNAWAYAGHNVMVFEGHPSAFESGVRDTDVLLVDSGMMPFIQFNYLDVAFRIMRPGGRVFIHDRKTYRLTMLTKDASKTSTSQSEADYVELLLRFLMRSSRSTVEVTSGEVVPDLADLLKVDIDWIAELTANRSKLNTDVVIDILLRRAGWQWYTPFKKTGRMKAAIVSDDGKVRAWNFILTLGKSSTGKRQVQIER